MSCQDWKVVTFDAKPKQDKKRVSLHLPSKKEYTLTNKDFCGFGH